MKQEIKVKVTFSEGYEKRFTKACLEVLKRRETMKELKGGTKCMQ